MLFDAAARLLADTAPDDNVSPPGNSVMGVGELANKLKRVVESEFGHVRLRGEISGYKRVASGHAYLSLKDENAVIDGVIWKGNVAAIGLHPAGRGGGDRDRQDHHLSGPFQISDRDRSHGIGGRRCADGLARKAEGQAGGEGLFAPSAKKPLPFLPARIGVVTSPTGAVIRDILHRLEDRCPTHVLVWPVKVQGAGAAEEVAAAVRGFDAMPPETRPDLVIVARGGGSIEDLWAFNEEVVVRAIAACRIPIISAVGHETDTTLADFAADLRAPTPTAAAEMAVPVLADLRLTLSGYGQRTEKCARRYHERGRERLEALVRVLPRRDALLGPQRQRADDLGARLDRGLERRVTVARGQLDRSGAALRLSTLERQLERAKDRVAATWRLVESLGPNAILDRGYAFVSARPSGAVVGSAEAARGAGAVTLHFRDGQVDAKVERSGAKAYGGAKSDQPTLL